MGLSGVWALAFVCSLAPCERYCTERGKQAAHRAGLGSCSWWSGAGNPSAVIVAVAESTYASLKLLNRWSKLADPIVFITRGLPPSARTR